MLTYRLVATAQAELHLGVQKKYEIKLMKIMEMIMTFTNEMTSCI